MKISTDGQLVELTDFPFSVTQIMAADVVIINTQDELMAELIVRALRADPSAQVYLKPIFLNTAMDKRIERMVDGLWTDQWHVVRQINTRVLHLLQSSIDIEDDLLKRMFELMYSRDLVMQPFKNEDNPLLYEYPLWCALKVEEEEDIFRAIRKGSIWNIFQTKSLFNIHLCKCCHGPNVVFELDENLHQMERMFEKVTCPDCSEPNSIMDIIELPIETITVEPSFTKDISTEIKMMHQFSGQVNNKIFQQLLRSESQRNPMKGSGHSYLCAIDIQSEILKKYIQQNKGDYEEYLKMTLRKFIQIDEQILFSGSKVFVLLLDILPEETTWLRKRLFKTLQNDLKSNFDKEATIILDISSVRQRT